MSSVFWLTVIVSAITDFVIGAGGCLTTAMIATGSATMPSTPVIVFAAVTGAVTAARRVQAIVAPPPAKKDKGGEADP